MSLEDSIVQAARDGLHKALSEALTGYNSPLRQQAEQVIAEHTPDLRAVMVEAVEGLFSDKSMRAELRDALQKKLARLLIDKASGELEKRLNEIRADATMRAKILLAVEQAITR